MKTVSVAIFAIGVLMLAVHLFQKLVTGYGSVDSSDAIAALLLAGVAHFIFQHNKTTAKTEE